jgi:hypothetical protein
MKVNLVNLKIILPQFFAVLIVRYLASSKVIELNNFGGMSKLSCNLNLFCTLFYIIAILL